MRFDPWLLQKLQKTLLFFWGGTLINQENNNTVHLGITAVAKARSAFKHLLSSIHNKMHAFKHFWFSDVYRA